MSQKKDLEKLGQKVDQDIEQLKKDQEHLSRITTPENIRGHLDIVPIVQEVIKGDDEFKK